LSRAKSKPLATAVVGELEPPLDLNTVYKSFSLLQKSDSLFNLNLGAG
jgi:hypothetical protein